MRTQVSHPLMRNLAGAIWLLLAALVSLLALLLVVTSTAGLLDPGPEADSPGFWFVLSLLLAAVSFPGLLAALHWLRRSEYRIRPLKGALLTFAAYVLAALELLLALAASTT